MRSLLVAGLVVLAGCTGAFGGDTTRDTSSVTAAPVPADTAGIVLPVTPDGTPAVGRIIAAHRTALSTRSFHLRVVRDGSESTTDVWVDRETGRLRVRQIRDGSTIGDAVVAGDTRYELAANGTVTTMPDDGTVPYLDSASGVFLLQQRVAGLVYNRTDTATMNGTAVAVLRATTTDSTISRSGFRTVVAADSRLYVDRDGVIRGLDHREEYADGTVRTLNVTVTIGGEVPLPEWYANATG